MSRMVEVYNDKIDESDKLLVKITAGTAKITPGEPHLVARVKEMPRGSVRVDRSGGNTVIYGSGCELVITYPKAASLDIVIGSGTAEVNGMSPKRSFDLSISSGTAMIGLDGLAKQSITGVIKSGTFSGTLSYMSRGVDSDIALGVNAGTVDVKLELPNSIAVRNSVAKIGAGRLRLPEERDGKNGEVRIKASIGAGTFTVRD